MTKVSTLRGALLAPIALMVWAGLACAQTSALSNRIERGYGSSADVMDKTFNPSTRDANGNRIVADGVIQSGVGNSALTTNSTNSLAGAQYFQSGAAGSASATAIGNMIRIDVNGTGNTVVLNSTQINNAPVSANAVLNGVASASN
ncbi:MULTISPECIES: holdfast anchoring protein HfaA [unclassified Caulobacter]|jgi:holdfast attachment protein HfaA|uniref:holdfast anchoring protein HfaA n=1 Tax=unclassified Caulobacter TaxID=2648921 RepID=UPI0007831CBA|nr:MULTISPECIES: holdfast anchoring protein HfaA [unclassified Caulobacter]AZS22106.1 endonuclease [Caulobacter sp. FWC26]